MLSLTPQQPPGGHQNSRVNSKITGTCNIDPVAPAARKLTTALTFEGLPLESRGDAVQSNGDR